MDFSALSAELQSIASRYNGPDTDANVSTTMYCEMFNKILQKTETEVQEYRDQIVILWMTLSQLCNTATTLTACKARDGLYQDIFLQCAKTVLNIKWQNLPEDDQAKQNFIETVRATHSQLVTTGFNRFTLLLQVMENPWTDPTLSEIMSGDADCEDEKASEYISKEDHLILKLRVEMLIQENCEEFALNLATALLQHQLFKDDLELRELQLSLLHKQSLMDKLQEECEKIVCHDGVKLILRLERKESNQSLCVRLVQLFLVQDWIKPDQNCCTQDLLKLWIRHQYIEDRDKEKFLESVWAIAKLSSCTEQICLLVTALQRECGNDLLQLFTDLCVYAVNVDKGCCEQQMLQGNMEGVRARQHAIAQTCRKLASLYSGVNPKISRISAITAFALDATLVNLCLVERMFNRKYCTHVSGKVKECVSCQKAFSSVTKCVIDVKVNPATLYEVERLLNMLRPYYLNPDMLWSQLLPVCQKFMKERVHSTSEAIAMEVEKNEVKVKSKTSSPKPRTKSTGTSTPSSKYYCDDSYSLVPKESVPQLKNKSQILTLKPARPVASTSHPQFASMQKEMNRKSPTASAYQKKASSPKQASPKSTSLKSATAAHHTSNQQLGQQVDSFGRPIVVKVPLFSEVASHDQTSSAITVTSGQSRKITMLSPASLQPQKNVYIKDPQSVNYNPATSNVDKPKKKSLQSIGEILEATKSVPTAKTLNLTKKPVHMLPTDGDLLRAARDYSLSMVSSQATTETLKPVQTYTTADLLRATKNLPQTNMPSAQNSQSFQAAKDQLQATKAAFAASVLGIIPNSQSAVLTGVNRNVLTSGDLLRASKEHTARQEIQEFNQSLMSNTTSSQAKPQEQSHTLFTDLLRATKSTPVSASKSASSQTPKRQQSPKSRSKSPKQHALRLTGPISVPDLSMFKSKGIIPFVQANLQQFSNFVAVSQQNLSPSVNSTPPDSQTPIGSGKKIPFSTTLAGERLHAGSNFTVTSSSNAPSLSAVRPPSNSFQIPKNKDGSHRPRIIPIRTPSKSFPPYTSSEVVMEQQPQISTVSTGSFPPSEVYSMLMKEQPKAETVVKKAAKVDPRRPSADELQSIVDWLQTGTEDDKTNPATKMTSAAVSSVVLNSVASTSLVLSSSTATEIVTTSSPVMSATPIPSQMTVSITPEQLNQLMLAQNKASVPQAAGQLQQMVVSAGVASIPPQQIQLITGSETSALNALTVEQPSATLNTASQPSVVWASASQTGQTIDTSSLMASHHGKMKVLQYLGKIKGSSLSDKSILKSPKFILPNVSGAQMLGTVITTQTDSISGPSKIRIEQRRSSTSDLLTSSNVKPKLSSKSHKKKEKQDGTSAHLSSHTAKIQAIRRASLPTDLTKSSADIAGAMDLTMSKSAMGGDLQVISKAKLIAALQSKFSSPEQLKEFSSKWPETVAVNMQLVASVVDRELKRRSEMGSKSASHLSKSSVVSTHAVSTARLTSVQSATSSIQTSCVTLSTDTISKVSSSAETHVSTKESSVSSTDSGKESHKIESCGLQSSFENEEIEAFKGKVTAVDPTAKLSENNKVQQRKEEVDDGHQSSDMECGDMLDNEVTALLSKENKITEALSKKPLVPPEHNIPDLAAEKTAAVDTSGKNSIPVSVAEEGKLKECSNDIHLASTVEVRSVLDTSVADVQESEPDFLQVQDNHQEPASMMGSDTFISALNNGMVDFQSSQPDQETFTGASAVQEGMVSSSIVDNDADDAKVQDSESFFKENTENSTPSQSEIETKIESPSFTDHDAVGDENVVNQEETKSCDLREGEDKMSTQNIVIPTSNPPTQQGVEISDKVLDIEKVMLDSVTHTASDTEANSIMQGKSEIPSVEESELSKEQETAGGSDTTGALQLETVSSNVDSKNESIIQSVTTDVFTKDDDMSEAQIPDGQSPDITSTTATLETHEPCTDGRKIQEISEITKDIRTDSGEANTQLEEENSIAGLVSEILDQVEKSVKTSEMTGVESKEEELENNGSAQVADEESVQNGESQNTELLQATATLLNDEHETDEGFRDTGQVLKEFQEEESVRIEDCEETVEEVIETSLKSVPNSDNEIESAVISRDQCLSTSDVMPDNDQQRKYEVVKNEPDQKVDPPQERLHVEHQDCVQHLNVDEKILKTEDVNASVSKSSNDTASSAEVSTDRDNVKDSVVKEKLFAFGFGSDDDEFLGKNEMKEKETKINPTPDPVSESDTVSVTMDQTLVNVEAVPTDAIPDVTMDIFNTQVSTIQDASHELLALQLRENVAAHEERRMFERQDSSGSEKSWISGSSEMSNKSGRRSTESEDSGTKILSLQRRSTSRDKDGIRFDFFGPQNSRKEARLKSSRSHPSLSSKLLASTASVSVKKVRNTSPHPIIKNELIATRPLKQKVQPAPPKVPPKPVKPVTPPEESFPKKNINMCIICSKTFKSVESLKCHIRNICRPSAFKSEKSLRDFEYKMVYKCVNCEFEFSKKDDLDKHIQLCCTEVTALSYLTKFKCKMCGEVFSTKDKIHEHVSRLCDKIQSYKQQKQDRLEHKEEVVKSIDKQWLDITSSGSVDDNTKCKDVENDSKGDTNITTLNKELKEEKQDGIISEDFSEKSNQNLDDSAKSNRSVEGREIKMEKQNDGYFENLDQSSHQYSSEVNNRKRKLKKNVREEVSNLKKTALDKKRKNSDNTEGKKWLLRNRGFDFFSKNSKSVKKTPLKKLKKGMKTYVNIIKTPDLHLRNRSVKKETMVPKDVEKTEESKIFLNISKDLMGDKDNNETKSEEQRVRIDDNSSSVQETDQVWDVEKHRKELKELRKSEKLELEHTAKLYADMIEDPKSSEEKVHKTNMKSKKGESETSAKKPKFGPYKQSPKVGALRKSPSRHGKRVITKAKKFLDDEYEMPEIFKTQVASSNIKRQFRSKRMIDSQTTSLLRSRELNKSKGSADIKCTNSLGGSEKTDRCPKCCQSFKSVYSLTQHIARVHLSPYKTIVDKKTHKLVYMCKFCSRISTTYIKFCEHIQVHRDKVLFMVSKMSDDLNVKRTLDFDKRKKNSEVQGTMSPKKTKPFKSDGEDEDTKESKKTCVVLPVCLETRNSKYQRREVDSVSVSSNDKEDDATSTSSTQMDKRSRSSTGSGYQAEKLRGGRLKQRETSEDRDSFTSEDSLIHKHFTRRQLEKFDMLLSKDHSSSTSSSLEKISPKTQRLDRKRDDLSVTSDESLSDRKTRNDRVHGVKTRHQKQSSWDKESVTSDDSHLSEKQKKDANKDQVLASGELCSPVTVSGRRKQSFSSEKDFNTEDKPACENRLIHDETAATNESNCVSNTEERLEPRKRRQKSKSDKSENETKSNSLKRKPSNQVSSNRKKRKSDSESPETLKQRDKNKATADQSGKISSSPKTYKLRNTPSHQQACASGRGSKGRFTRKEMFSRVKEGNEISEVKTSKKIKKTTKVERKGKDVHSKNDSENMADADSEHVTLTRRRSGRLNAPTSLADSKSVSNVVKHSKKLKSKYEKYSKIKVSGKRVDQDVKVHLNSNRKRQQDIKKKAGPPKKRPRHQDNDEKTVQPSAKATKHESDTSIEHSVTITAIEEDDEFAYVKSPVSAKSVHKPQVKEKKFVSNKNSNSEFLESFKSYIGNNNPSTSSDLDLSPSEGDVSLKSLKQSASQVKARKGKTVKISKLSDAETGKEAEDSISVDSDSDEEVVFMDKSKKKLQSKNKNLKSLGKTSVKPQIDSEENGDTQQSSQDEQNLNLVDTQVADKKPPTFLDSFIAYHSHTPPALESCSIFSNKLTGAISKSVETKPCTTSHTCESCSKPTSFSIGSKVKKHDCKYKKSKQQKTLQQSGSKVSAVVKRKYSRKGNNVTGRNSKKKYRKISDLKRQAGKKAKSKTVKIREKTRPGITSSQGSCDQSARKMKKSIAKKGQANKSTSDKCLSEKQVKQLAKKESQKEKGSGGAATHSMSNVRSDLDKDSPDHGDDTTSKHQEKSVDVESKKCDGSQHSKEAKDRVVEMAAARPTSFESLQTYIDSMSNSPATVIESPTSEKVGAKPETKMSQAFVTSFQDSFMTYIGSANKNFGKVGGSCSSSECGDIKVSKSKQSESGQSKPFTWDMDSGDEDTKSNVAKSIAMSDDGSESGTSARNSVERGLPANKMQSKSAKVRHLYHDGKIWQIGKGSVTSVPVLPSETESMGSGRSIGRESPVSVLSDLSDYSKDVTAVTSLSSYQAFQPAETTMESSSTSLTSSSTSQVSTLVTKCETATTVTTASSGRHSKADSAASRKCDPQNISQSPKKRDKLESTSPSSASSKIELIVVDRKLDSEGFCLLKADENEYDKLNTYTSLASAKDLIKQKGDNSNKSSKWKVQTDKKQRAANSKEFPFVFKKSRRT